MRLGKMRAYPREKELAILVDGDGMANGKIPVLLKRTLG